MDKIFNNWLFGSDKSYNPFTRMFAKIGRDLPQLELPDMSFLKARCTKCGDDIQGEENSICGNCI